MLNTAATLKSFFSGFEIQAYTLNSVPDSVTLPYVTYPLFQPEWNGQSNFYAQVWYPKNQLESLLTKADQITAAIGQGIRIEHNTGYVVIYPATPLIQILSDDYTQSAYINLLINVYQMPGN